MKEAMNVLRNISLHPNDVKTDVEFNSMDKTNLEISTTSLKHSTC